VLGDAGKDTGMTVHKRVRHGKPRWVIEIPYRHRLSGKRVRFRKDADVQTSAAAHAEERRLIAEYEAHGFIRTTADKRKQAAMAAKATASLTFKDAYDVYMETKGVTRLKLTTRTSYAVSARAYLLPRWSTTRIEDLGYVEFERLDADLKKLDLKPTTRGNVINAARSVLRWCVASGHLRDMPRLPQVPKGGEAVVRPPTAEEVADVLQAAKPHVRLALALCADAGLRAGEVCGLEWQDVDLKDGKLIVRQTVYYGKKDTPKSGHERQVPLTKRLRALLTEAASKPHLLTDPVAPNRDGKVWGKGSLLHAFQRTLKQVGLASARVHDLRHFFVTEAFKAGGAAPMVQKLAGHRHMHVTARYAHADEEATRAVIEAIDRRHGS
jgi:integrase